MVILGFIEKSHDSDLGDPSFSQPKPRTNWLCFLSEFGILNKQLKCKPYTIPKENKILLKLEGFNYDTSIDLNMGY